MGLGLERECFKRRRTVGRIRSTLGERRPFWSRPYTVLLGVHHTQAGLVGVLFLRHVVIDQVLGVRRWVRPLAVMRTRWGHQGDRTPAPGSGT